MLVPPWAVALCGAVAVAALPEGQRRPHDAPPPYGDSPMHVQDSQRMFEFDAQHEDLSIHPAPPKFPHPHRPVSALNGKPDDQTIYRFLSEHHQYASSEKLPRAPP